MALRITSLGPLDYRMVRLRVVPPPENLRPPIEAVMFEYVWGQEVDLGPLRSGQVAEVLLRREEDAPEGTARLVFTCPSRWRTRQVLRSVRLEGPHRSSRSPLSEVLSRPSATNRIDRAPTWNSRHVILLVIPPGTTRPGRSALAGPRRRPELTLWVGPPSPAQPDSLGFGIDELGEEALMTVDVGMDVVGGPPAVRPPVDPGVVLADGCRGHSEGRTHERSPNRPGEGDDLEHLVAVRAPLAGSAARPVGNPARSGRRCGRLAGGLGDSGNNASPRVRWPARAACRIRFTVLSTGT
jgi:hypothetical protein